MEFLHGGLSFSDIAGIESFPILTSLLVALWGEGSIWDLPYGSQIAKQEATDSGKHDVKSPLDLEFNWIHQFGSLLFVTLDIDVNVGTFLGYSTF